MNISRFLTRAWFMRLLLLTVAGGALYWCIGMVRASMRATSLDAVDMSGVHHLGDKFNVPQFYVDGHDGSNVGREGGGGFICCVLLPKKWRPGLSVEVRWAIDDFSHENPAQVAVGNFDSVVGEGTFIARVPVERYEVAEHVWIHFFAGGKVRVVSSPTGYWGAKHPIQDNDPHAADMATAGRRVAAMFSPEELAEIDRKDLERRKTQGDWR
jgi:hypothetical protein